MNLKEYDGIFGNRCDAYFRQQVLDIIEDLNYNELQTLLDYLKVMPRRNLESVEDGLKQNKERKLKKINKN